MGRKAKRPVYDVDAGSEEGRQRAPTPARGRSHQQAGDSPPGPVAEVMGLQRAAGNQAVVRLLAQGGRPGADPLVVRRLLIPKANAAMDAAIALNPADYTQAKQDLDDEATKSEQETLTEVPLKGKTEKAEQKTVANLVRAVVLTEFSKRLVPLKTATNDQGAPLSDKAKNAKRAVYQKKADEFRQKHVPLAAAGLATSETQAFLRHYGFDAAIQPTKRAQAEARAGGARIDVRSTFIGGEILGMRMRSHLFIVYTAKDGRQMYFRGGPDEDDFTVAELGDYTPDSIDWDPSAPTVTVLEGPKAEGALDRLIEATYVIDDMKVPYRATISREWGGDRPNVLQTGINLVGMGLTSEGENCNSTAWTILTRAGVPTKKPGGKHPGWGANLGSRTAGKENALPAPETHGTAHPYVIDERRDLANDRGSVQVFKDRKRFEPDFKVGVGTKVTLLDEFTTSRKIQYAGTVGYIPRSETDAMELEVLEWREILDDRFSDADIKWLAETDEAASVDQRDQVEEDTGIPADWVQHVAAMANMTGGQRGAYLIDQRIEDMGETRAKAFLADPYEINNVAKQAGLDPSDVVQLVTNKYGELDRRDRARAALAKRNPDPLAADYAVNEIPDHPTLNSIATELHMPYDEVLTAINDLRPMPRQNIRLIGLVQSNKWIMNSLDHPPDNVVTNWALQLELPKAFVRDRLLEAGRQQKKRREVEAAKARIAEEERRDKADPRRVAIKKALNDRLGSNRDIPFILNDVPEFTVIEEIATELGIGGKLVFDTAWELLAKPIELLQVVFPKLERSYLKKMAAGRKSTLDYVKHLAGSCGVTVEYVQKRADAFVISTRRPPKPKLEPKDVGEVVRPPKQEASPPDRLELYFDNDDFSDYILNNLKGLTFLGPGKPGWVEVKYQNRTLRAKENEWEAFKAAQEKK